MSSRAYALTIRLQYLKATLQGLLVGFCERLMATVQVADVMAAAATTPVIACCAKSVIHVTYGF